MTDKLQEDTVSADRKERIIFDPSAWRKSDKSGRKTSAITSRQNFDNEKFTRKSNKEGQVDEGTIQPSGDSKIDSAGPTQSDLIKKGKDLKSNSPQIEFVTGVEADNKKVPQMDNQPRQGVRKIAENLIKKAMKQVSEGKMGEKAAGDLDFNAKAKKDDSVPFDGPYTKTPDVVVDNSGARHTAYSRVRSLARQALAKQDNFNHEHSHSQTTHKNFKEENELAEAQYAGLEKEDKPGKVKTAVVKSHPKAVEIETVEGWKDEKKPVKEEVVAEGNGYDDNRTGFAKKPREDDEYHNEPKPKFKAKSTMDRPHTVHIGGKPWKKFSNGAQAKAAVKTLQSKGKDAVAVAHFKEEEETDMSKTYADFIQQLQEYNAGKDGVYRHKGTYGGSYDSNDDEDDDAPKKPAAPAVKRGRGRPAGSKSGANQKVTTGKSYGGIATHSLNLPNSNR